jgi:hypothetical protein
MEAASKKIFGAAFLFRTSRMKLSVFDEIHTAQSVLTPSTAGAILWSAAA